MSENPPQGRAPRLGTPQIKSGPRRPAEQSTAPYAEEPVPTRRSLHQPRRVDSAAGAPAGMASRGAILELPATSISPSDVGPLAGQSPTDRYSSHRGTGGGVGVTSSAAPAPEFRVDHDGVPVGPDGRPLTRRQLRAWRNQQEESSAGSAATAATLSEGSHPPPRRAEAPAGSPGPVAPETPTRESLAAEGAALAARIEESGGGDPSAVDPVLLREQELLAERARQVNTGLISRVPVNGPAATAPESPSTPAAAAVATSSTPGAPAQEPVQAQSAHGLDSLGASAWSARERNLILAAALVILVLLLALVLALVL